MALHKRQKSQKYNSVSHVERAVVAVMEYYQRMNGRVPGKHVLVDFRD